MSWFAKRRLSLLAFTLALAFPSVLYAGFFSNWWNSPPPPPIEDVVFDPVSTFSELLRTLEVQNGQISSNTVMQFPSVDLTAQVASEEITFDQIVLMEDPYTITIDVDPASLSTHKFGSRFSADAMIMVDNGTDTVDIEGRIVGRISARNGNYYLSGVVFGTYLQYQGSGNGTLEIVRVPLYGMTPIPSP